MNPIVNPYISLVISGLMMIIGGYVAFVYRNNAKVRAETKAKEEAAHQKELDGMGARITVLERIINEHAVAMERRVTREELAALETKMTNQVTDGLDKVWEKLDEMNTHIMDFFGKKGKN